MNAASNHVVRIACAVVLIVFDLLSTSQVKAQFKPGNVFVSEGAYKRCMRGDQYGWDRIWEIDPYTGEVTLFAEMRDEDCGVLSGLVFTPDGCRLRASQYLTSRILEFDPDGNWTTVLDLQDGIVGPLGSNNLAYAPDGSFFVVNHVARNIMKFPVEGVAGEVFADGFDGIRGYGSITFAVNGDLFYGNRNFSAYVARISPDGMASLFDPLEDSKWDPDSLAADHRGHLFMVLSNGDFYTYDATEAASRVFGGPLLAGYPVYASTGPIILDWSETWLFVTVQPDHELVGIHLSTRRQQVLAIAVDASPTFGSGSAVAPVLRGDVDRDADVDVEDSRTWGSCVTGPQKTEVPLECALWDQQRDFDVDLADFAVFQAVFGARREDCSTDGVCDRGDFGAIAAYHGVLIL